jgi:hypothetical protein
MLEPLANAAEEAQALSRVHRIGQTHPVRCVIFYAKNTYEERLLSQRQKAGTLSSAIANFAENDEFVRDDAHANNKKSSGSMTNFFNTAQLAHLFGCSENRKRMTEEYRTKGSGQISSSSSSSQQWLSPLTPNPFVQGLLNIALSAPSGTRVSHFIDLTEHDDDFDE